MITEDFCSPEVAKLLEEKGFVKDCGRIHAVCNGFTVDTIVTPDAPTHQSALKWLREVHSVFIEMFCYAKGDYAFSITKMMEDNIDGFPLPDEDASYSTYEEAVEAALKYTLENLI